MLPNLKNLSLDPMHVCFAADRCLKKARIQPSVVGLVLRAIMGKFNIPDAAIGAQEPYTGGRQKSTPSAKVCQ